MLELSLKTIEVVLVELSPQISVIVDSQMSGSHQNRNQKMSFSAYFPYSQL